MRKPGCLVPSALLTPSALPLQPTWCSTSSSGERHSLSVLAAAVWRAGLHGDLNPPRLGPVWQLKKNGTPWPWRDSIRSNIRISEVSARPISTPWPWRRPAGEPNTSAAEWLTEGVFRKGLHETLPTLAPRQSLPRCRVTGGGNWPTPWPLLSTPWPRRQARSTRGLVGDLNL